MKYDRHIDKTEERKLQEKLRFAGEKVPSMKRRSNINDYYGRHIYMVTMAVEGRRPLLGTLRGSSTIAGNQEGAPCVVPTPLGQEVTRCWELIPEFHHEVRLLAFQLMPDHLHGILFVQEAMEEHLGQVISGFKAGCNKAYRQMVLEAVPQRTLIASASAYEVVSPLPLPSKYRLKKDDRSPCCHTLLPIFMITHAVWLYAASTPTFSECTVRRKCVGCCSRLWVTISCWIGPKGNWWK